MNKGFTLVELIAVIAIMLFLGFITVPKVLDIINNNREKGYLEIEKRLEEAASKYIIDKYIDPNIDSIVITKQDLIDAGYIKEVYDLKDNSVCDVSVYVYNLNSVAEFNPILTCSSYETKGRNAAWYIKDLYADESLRTSNGLIEDTTPEQNIRYAGATADVKNKVYFNCAETDGTNAYGSENYNYESSCEIWRIIGVFDTKSTDSETEDAVPRIKIVRDAVLSTSMEWDTTADGVDYINQWGETTLTSDDTTPYNGASLKQYLNGDYYNSLTSIAKGQIGTALWYTGAVTKDTASGVYEDERSNATGTGTTVKYTTKWAGMIGLIYTSDFGYAGINCGSYTINNYGDASSCGTTRNWLTPSTGMYWTISPRASISDAAWNVASGGFSRLDHVSRQSGVRPAAYLSSNVQIIGGDGSTVPYKLKLNSGQ